jgi:2-polyprenyl-6-methoxyphenol hydroxylase-like FAD-dependent oxidoreductase
MNGTADVAIVGFGPGGAVLASLLGQAGHRVVVFDKFPAPYGLPRMSTIDGEIARLLQHTGDPKDAMDGAIPQWEVEIFGADKELVGRIDWNYTRGGHPSHLSLHQPNIEAAMEARIQACPEVTVLWGREVSDIEPAEEGYTVTAIARDSDDSMAEKFSARYVVGMDGASSFVRSKMGIVVRTIHSHSDRWILTDFDVLKPLPNNLDHRLYFELDIDQPYYYGPNGAARCRTDVRMLPDDDSDAELEENRAYEFLEQRVGIPPDRVKVTRRVLYRYRSQIAARFRTGDVFIGGDAAHAMTPYMGQGACTAMRDGVNLAWKLDLILSGRADRTLLDSYEIERYPQGEYFVQGSLAVWAMINPESAEKAAERDAFLKAAGADAGPPIPGLSGGILHRSADGALAAQAGELSPQGQVVIDGRAGLLDDLVGFGFQLVTAQPVEEALGAERIARLDELGARRVVIDGSGLPGRATDVDGTYGDYFALHGSDTLLGRPDFYVFGLASGIDETVALVDDLLVQVPRSTA